MSLDKSYFTRGRSRLELRNSSPSKRIDIGTPGETRKFLAVAHLDAVPLDPDQQRALYQGSTTPWTAEVESTTRIEYTTVVCKIIGNVLGQGFLSPQNNAHNYLPKCGADQLDHLLVNCIHSSPGYNGDSYITEGDKLIIRCEYDRYGRLNLKTGTVVKIKRKWGVYGLGRGVRCYEAEHREHLEELF